MNEPDWKGFAIAIMSDWPDCGTLDGFDLQEIAARHGLLIKERRTVPCEDGESCACSEACVSGEETDCYRIQWSRG